MAVEELNEVVVNVSLARIDPPKIAARLWKNEERLAELREDMAANGLNVPICVRPVGDRFEVVYGDRRSTVARQLGWETIPAIIREMDDKAALLKRFGENQHHDKPNPVEDAYYFDALVKQYQLSEAELCETVGKTPDFIAKRLRILRMPVELIDSVAEGKIPLGVAEALMQVTDEAQRRSFLFHAILSEHSVNTVKGWVHTWKSTQAPGSVAAPQEPSVVHGDPQAPATLTCVVCGPCSDTHALVTVFVHPWEIGMFQKAIARAKRELSGEVE